MNSPNQMNLLLEVEQDYLDAFIRIFSSTSNPPQLGILANPLYCHVQTETFNRKPSPSMTLKNGLGELTNTFVAGTIDQTFEMIIQGSGFGDSVGHITFANADSGGATTTAIDKATDLVYWTDTEIRFKVPQKAGTGDMTLLHSDGSSIGSIPITIMWSLNPIYHNPSTTSDRVRQRTHFVNNNEEGGYNLKLNTSTGFAGDTEAVAAFQRALEKWQCSTNINWILSETTETASQNDGICVIEYSTELPQGVLAIASSRYKGSRNSSCEHHSLFWRIHEFDISFADPSTLPPGFSWNYSSDSPAANEFDFESIALHELGHAHGLGHVIDESSAMHFAIGNGELKRELYINEEAGASYKMGHSTAENCINSFDPMVAINSPCATATSGVTANRTRIKVLLEGFYDESTSSMTTFLLENDLIPAEQPFNQAPFNYSGNESVTSIPRNVVDWILLELRDPLDQENIIYQQALFLKDDGSLVNLDGTSDILLENVASGEYYVCIAHANHLSVISNTPHTIQESALLYDFSTTETAAMGSEQLKEKNGVYVLHSGDFDGNGLINNQDYNLWKINSSSLNVYSPADADGNGLINNQDYNLWKVNLSKIGLINR